MGRRRYTNVCMDFSGMITNLPKQLSYILRHNPESVGLSLDVNGWVRVTDLCTTLDITDAELSTIVEDNTKQRFEFDITGEMIRARQGHSLKVDLGLKPKEPPDVLLHGTKDGVVRDILKDGISKMTRQYVQLSRHHDVAKEVAQRRKGKSAMLEINAKRMFADGYQFFRSSNGVWMTDNVPPKYIKVVPLDKPDKKDDIPVVPPSPPTSGSIPDKDKKKT